MEFFICVGYISFFVFVILRLNFFKVDGITYTQLIAAFLAKVVSGIILGIIYTYYYTDRLTSDTFKFFDDSKIMFDVYWTNPSHFFRMLTGYQDDAPYLKVYYDTMHNWYNKVAIFNDYRTQIRINTLLRFISLGYYNVHAVVFSFLSFCGLTAILKLCVADLKSKRRVLYFAIYFLPSVLFWGSGLLKDALIFSATGLSLYYLNKCFVTKIKVQQHLILSLLFLLFLMSIKFHNYILFFPLYVAYAWSMYSKKNIFLKFGLVILVYYFVLIRMDYVLPDYGMMELLSKKQREFLDLKRLYNPESGIAVSYLSSSVINGLKNTPEALYNVFCRPWFFESKSPFMLMAGFENLLLLSLTALSVIAFRKSKLQFTPLFFLSLFYVLSLFELIGLVTPVMGAIVRYKAQALPFLVFILIAAIDKNTLLIRLPFLKKIFSTTKK